MAVVQNREGGQSFEMTPMGVVSGLTPDAPTGMLGLNIGEAEAPPAQSRPTLDPASVDRAMAQVERRLVQHNVRHVETNKISSRSVVKSARARAKEIRAELRRMKSLQKELAQLERLIAAADGKTPAIVRDIRRTAV